MLGRNILAVYPHRRRSSEVRFIPPIGLEYVLAAVRDLVDNVTIVDMRFETDDDLARLVAAKPDSVCISLNWKPSNPERDVVPEFDLINHLPADLFTVVGGRWATLNVETVFAECPHVDVVVLGDGEETLRELVQSTSPADVAGLAWRDDTGAVRRTAPRPFAPLSETVYPLRGLRRHVYTASAGGADTGITVDTVLSSHGCPFNCKFCTCNLDWMGRRRPWQPRSPESVVAELRTIDAEIVFFADNNFCVDMDRVGKICDLLLREKIRKTFAVEARIEIARRPDVLAKMARAGFRMIMFGIESACDASLELLNKGFTTADVREALAVLRPYPFVLGAFFIIGNIGEDRDDMLRMSRFARELGIDFISLSYLRADPGSALEEIVRGTPGYHIVPGPKPRVYSDRYSFRDLRRIKSAMVRDFYYHPHMLRSMRRVLAAGFLKGRHVGCVAHSAAVLALRRLLPATLARRLSPPGGRA